MIFIAEIQVVRFKELYIASIIIFAVGIALIPLNQFYATLILFGLIGLWSRVPTFFADFLKDFEQVDFLTIMIAVNVDGMTAGIFGMVTMLFARAFAPLEWPLYTVKDSISFFVAGNLTPFFYSFWGHNLFFTAYTFTAVRWLFYLVLTALIESDALGLELGYVAMSIPTAYLINTGAIAFFAPLTAPILKRGFGINAELIAMAILILGLATLAQYLNKKYGHKMKKKGHEVVEPQVIERKGIHF